MSKQAAKHHRKAARRERAERHVKRVGGGKPTREKLVTREEHGVGEAYAKISPDTVEVGGGGGDGDLPRRPSGSRRGRTRTAFLKKRSRVRVI